MKYNFNNVYAFNVVDFLSHTRKNNHMLYMVDRLNGSVVLVDSMAVGELFDVLNADDDRYYFYSKEVVADETV